MWESIVNFFTSQQTVESILRVLGAILILIIGFKIVKGITKKIAKGKAFVRFGATIKSFLKNIIAWVLYVLVILLACIVLGVDLTAFSAVIASLGVTIGLALQGGLSNIAGGIMIVAFKPFQVDDYIINSGVEGTVTDIGIFYTSLVTPDNKKVVIPNSSASNSVVINVTANETRRVDFSFSVAYNTNLLTAQKVLLATAAKEEKVAQDPEPRVVITEYAESGIVMSLRVWVKTEDYWDVYFSIMDKVKDNFDCYNIEIPYPQLDVHFPNKK